MAFILNWILAHTGKRWKVEQERIIQENRHYDVIIGQLR